LPTGETFSELTERDQRNNIWRLSIAQALAGAKALVQDHFRPVQHQGFGQAVVVVDFVGR
jgi:hypothetical protein